MHSFSNCLMIKLSFWVADTIAPASMHVLYIALRYNKPNKPENHKSVLFITFL